MRVLRSVAALVVSAIALVACADLFGFHDLVEGSPDASDAGNDTAAEVGPTCTPATWPASPTQENKGDAGQFVVALHHVYFSSAPDGGTATYGYDLDGKCTTSPATESCSGVGVNDQPNGVDDESINLMNTLVGAYPGVTDKLSDDNLNAAVATGYFTVLMRLLNYNGGSNQPLNKGLQVGIQASPGITNGPPKLDGTDVWNVSVDDAISSSSTYPKNLYDGYVANGTLVVKFTAPLTLHLLLPPNSISGPFALILQKPTMTAKLVPHGAGYDLVDGLIVGRWATKDVISQVASLTINGSSLCDYMGGAVWPLVTGKVCAHRDIRSLGPDNDTTTCDAVSMAIAFDGVVADVTSTPVAFPTSATPCSFDAGDCDQ